MHFRHTISFYVLFSFLVLSSNGLALKNREHASNVATLREAVSNAFDALTEVEEAIPKSDGDVFEEESIDYGDVNMDKETAEKFVEEIDELEDMLLNKDNSVAANSEKQRKEEIDVKDIIMSDNVKNSLGIDELSAKKRKDFDISDFLQKRGKDYSLKDFFEESMNMKNRNVELKDDKKDIETSIDVLLDVLKNDLGEKKHESKFEEYLLSNFAKEAHATKDTKDLKSVTGSKKETNKVEVHSSNIKKSNVSQVKKETENCGNSKKECGSKDENKKEVADKTETKKDAKVERKDSTESKTIKKKTANPHAKSVTHSTPKHKRPLWSKKQASSDGQYDREIKDLVKVILKRREESKREKIKLALADLFDILDTKRTRHTRK